MHDLTPRQINILRCLIEEYIETAHPVGSESLEKKYSLGVSPATIRNEMAALTQMGYLKKGHLSAGRSPTSMALKYYVKKLLKTQKLSVSEEVGVKESLWPHRNEFEHLLHQSTRELADRTRNLGLATTDQGQFYAHGAAHLLEQPEFFEIDVTRTLLTLIDQSQWWLDLVKRITNDGNQEDFYLLVGEDLGMQELQPCSFVYQSYQCGPNQGIIGVIGPARQHYESVLPMVDYFAQLISSISTF